MRSTTNIQQRGSKFRVDVTLKGKRERVTCDTMEEAKSVRAKLELATQSIAPKALHLVGSPWTLGHAVLAVEETIWRGTANEKNAIRNAQYAVTFFGKDTILDDITTDWIDTWITSLKEKKNTNSTVNKKLAALSKVMTFARQRGHMTGKPHMERRKEYLDEREIRWMTDSEEDTLLALLSRWGKDCHAEACCVLIDTGLRPSELWELEGRKVRLELGFISLDKTKNHKARSVPMTERVKQILSRRMECTPTGKLFPHNNSWLRGAWDRAKFSMGLSEDEHFVPYSMRHTCASRLVQRGVAIDVVQIWMGHKTIQVTMRYAKQNPTNLMAAVKVLQGN